MLYVCMNDIDHNILYHFMVHEHVSPLKIMRYTHSFCLCVVLALIRNRVVLYNLVFNSGVCFIKLKTSTF